MRAPVQEALEPDSDAIRKGTVEFEVCLHRVKVRYKNLAGYVQRRNFPATDAGREMAQEFFTRCVDDLRREVS